MCTVLKRFVVQIAVDRAAPQDEMANAAYLNHVGPGAAAASTGGAGGPIRGSNAPLPGSGYGGIQGNLDFNAGVSYRIQIIFSPSPFSVC